MHRAVVTSLLNTNLHRATAAAMALSFASASSAGLIGGNRGTPQPMVIDEFIDIQEPWPITINTSVAMDGNNETGLTGVLGGARASTLSNGTFGSSVDFAEALVAPNVDGGVLDYNSTVFASARLSLVYGNGVPAFDFSNQAGIVIDFIGFDFPDGGPLDVSIILTSGGEVMSTSTSVTESAPAEVFLSFDDLAARGVFDLSSVDDIAVRFEAAAGSDFRIGAIRTRLVPAPGGLALLGFAAAAFRRRRRA